MLRAEITVFPIFSENSAPAVAHLLKNTRASHILVSSELIMQEVAKNALLTMDPSDVPKMCPMPAYEDIFSSGSQFSPLPSRRKDYSVTRIIVHSSGMLGCQLCSVGASSGSRVNCASEAYFLE